MGRSSCLLAHPLPKHSWPARQKEKLDQPDATKRFDKLSVKLCQKTQASVALRDRIGIFEHLTDALQSVCDLYEFDRHISIYRDLKMGESPAGSRPRHRACAVGYSPTALARGHGSLFPVDSPVPMLEDLRLKRYEAIVQASFLLFGDGASRAFKGSSIPSVVQDSLRAMGQENFDMLDPQKAFQTSSFNHVGCQLGLLSHLTFIYQCEIREDAKVMLSVIWVKVVQDEDDASSTSSDDGRQALRYCKAPIEAFDLTDVKQAAKLFAWLHSISKWALRERLEALRMAQQLDEVRQKRFLQANISILQEFGADLGTAWLADDILKAIPCPTSFDPRSVRSRSEARSAARSAGRSAKSPVSSLSTRRIPDKPPVIPAKRPRKDKSPSPPLLKLEPEPTPPPTIAWKGLLPPHKLEGFPKDATGPATTSPVDRTHTSSTESGASDGRSVSLERQIATKKKQKRVFSERLVLMTAIYDSVLPSPTNPETLRAEPIFLQQVPSH